MKIHIEDNYEKLSSYATKLVANHIQKNPKIVLGLPTGATPIGLYKKLSTLYKKGQIETKQITTFNLDEYCGLGEKHPQSYRFFMKKNLFSKINLKEHQTHFPLCENKLCNEFEIKIEKAGGIDLQILGIGTNGHIGFNEPGSKFNSKTRIVKISEETISNNAKYFKSSKEVPRKASTMGIETIMKAREIILLASGKSKAKIIQKTLKGSVDENIPASILQNHKNITIILDKDATQFTYPL